MDIYCSNIIILSKYNKVKVSRTNSNTVVAFVKAVNIYMVVICLLGSQVEQCLFREAPDCLLKCIGKKHRISHQNTSEYLK